MGKSSPYISIRLVNQNGELIQSMASRKSKRIFYFIQTNDFPECLFEVSVTYSNGFKNETQLLGKELVVKTLNAFLEK